MTSSTGNQGNFSQEKFVPRVEMAIMQYVILSKAQQQGGITKENLQQTFRGSMQMSQDHFQHCIEQLTRDGHLRQSGNKYEVTDDGREDVQKLQNIVLELPNVVQQQGGAQRQPGQQAVSGGAGAGSPRTGGAGSISGGGMGSTGRTGGQGSQGGQGGQGGQPGQNR